MTRRFLVTRLVSATLYAGLLSAVPALAQAPDGAPDDAAPLIGSPSATPVPAEPTPEPTVDPTPTATPTPAPTVEPTAAPAPAPSPAEPAVPPQPTATPAPRAKRAPKPKATPAPRTKRAPKHKSKHAPAAAHDRTVRRRRHAGTETDRAPRRPVSPPAPRSLDAGARFSQPATPFAPLASAQIGIPESFIDDFRIPPFLLPIYQAAGMQYGVPWEVLAAINEIETGFGRNLNVSGAGAMGWMQFMPATWADYGVDANRDGRKDPYNPVDAIFAAARYLRAAGADRDLRAGVLAYNHAGWYADAVLDRAREIGAMPSDLVGSLTALAQGRFPIRGAATYESGTDGHGVELEARAAAVVIAVADGRITRAGRSNVELRDVHGNTYTYAGLGEVARTVERGARVTGGTPLGKLEPSEAARMRFEIRPAGHDAPRIDPKPILDGWKLLESAGAEQADERGPLFDDKTETPSIGRLMLMDREALARRVLVDARIEIYECGRTDIRAGRIDRRVLATMLYLVASGLKPTISSLECGHGTLTTSGNVSEHSTGTAMDIAAINGITITPATQGPGSIAEQTVRRLLTLQGATKPHQIISLMTFAGADNTFAMGDHDDHIHVGWQPETVNGRAAVTNQSALKPSQWAELTDRIADINNPDVRDEPSPPAKRVP